MADDIDAFMENLQEQVFDEAREAFGEAGYYRWRNPFYRGPLDDDDLSACGLLRSLSGQEIGIAINV